MPGPPPGGWRRSGRCVESAERAGAVPRCQPGLVRNKGSAAGAGESGRERSLGPPDRPGPGSSRTEGGEGALALSPLAGVVPELGPAEGPRGGDGFPQEGAEGAAGP